MDSLELAHLQLGVPFLTTYCLASEYSQLTPEQQAQVDHILADDGEWDRDMIALAIQFPLEDPSLAYLQDDWTKP